MRSLVLHVVECYAVSPFLDHVIFASNLSKSFNFLSVVTITLPSSDCSLSRRSVRTVAVQNEISAAFGDPRHTHTNRARAEPRYVHKVLVMLDLHMLISCLQDHAEKL